MYFKSYSWLKCLQLPEIYINTGLEWYMTVELEIHIIRCYYRYVYVNLQKFPQAIVDMLKDLTSYSRIPHKFTSVRFDVL